MAHQRINIARDKTFKILPTDNLPSEDDGVVPAYAKYPLSIKSADDEVFDAEWGQSEGTRQRHQIDKYKDETLGE